MKVQVWVEVLPDNWPSWRDYPDSAKVGKTWKRRPDRNKLAGGAIVVEVEIDIPRERMATAVKAGVPAPPPASVQ